MDHMGSGLDDAVQLLELAVPEVPEVSAETLDTWNTAHQRTAERVSDLDDLLAQALREWRLERCLEGLAGVTPSISGEIRRPLFPAPRRFLSPFAVERLEGCRAALDHVNVRLALIDDGLEQTLVRPETPYVLQTLVESRRTSEDVTNPGIIRVKESGWKIRHHMFTPPPPDMARPLLDLVTETIADRPASDATLGAWALFTLLSIHPFVDGNGRTARLLYLLIASLSIPELDLGTLEAIGLDRPTYVDALQEGQWTTPVWNPRLLDPRPFIEATYRWSVWGAARHVAQVDALERVRDELGRRFPHLSDAGIAILIRSALDRGLRNDHQNAWRPDELEQLVDAGLLRRHRAPASANVGRIPVLMYSPTRAVTDVFVAVVSEPPDQGR